MPLIRYLAQQNQLDSRDIALETARQFDLPLLDLDSFDLTRSPISEIGIDLCQRLNVLPLAFRRQVLAVATSDPTQPRRELQNQLKGQMSVQEIVVEEDKLARALGSFASADSSLLALGIAKQRGLTDAGSASGIPGGAPPGSTSNISVNTSAAANRKPSTATRASRASKSSAATTAAAPSPAVADKPLVRLINELMLEAVRCRASDVHFEPFQDRLRVRFRVDGVLHTARQETLELAKGVASRIKIMAGLNIAERRIPQDGHTTIVAPPARSIDVRVSTIPTIWGEKTVLRLLDASHTDLSIDQLGLFNSQKQHYLDALKGRQGLILITGPTGSGKTQTVYAGLNHLNQESRNIATVEDPVEIRLDGINQLQVNPRIGLSFASALRALLRQDPDALLVGEIRDSETAEIAIRAAQTGHLVLSTLHTNSAAETLTRLLNMGIPSFNLATATRMIVAQRLLRRLCPHCKKSQPVPEDMMKGVKQDEGLAAELGDRPRIYQARGCNRCLGGYHGRVGVYEVVPVSRAMSEIITQNGSSLALEEQMGKESLANMQQSALRHVAVGNTSLAEARRLL
ncbi:MAG: GspE/PulE family protein [Pseudohongiellaceae bacterium]